MANVFPSGMRTWAQQCVARRSRAGTAPINPRSPRPTPNDDGPADFPGTSLRWVKRSEIGRSYLLTRGESAGVARPRGLTGAQGLKFRTMPLTPGHGHLTSVECTSPGHASRTEVSGDAI